jgi:hypothetical protein
MINTSWFLCNLNDKSDGAACLGAGVSAFQHGPDRPKTASC